MPEVFGMICLSVFMLILLMLAGALGLMVWEDAQEAWEKRRRRRVPDGPENPANGHPWKCRCSPCSVFWDTAYGSALYRKHHHQAP